MHEGDRLDSTGGGSSAGSSRGKPHRGQHRAMARLDSSSAGYKRRACGGGKDGPPAKKANKESRLHTVRNAYEVSFFLLQKWLTLKDIIPRRASLLEKVRIFSFFLPPPHHL